MLRPPELGMECFCNKCSQWLDCSDLAHATPLHYLFEVKCPGSGYAFEDWRFVVGTGEEARVLAQFLFEDDGRCLDSFGGSRHSLNCGNGRDCEKERRRLAAALAVWVLRTERQEIKPVETKLATVGFPGDDYGNTA